MTSVFIIADIEGSTGCLKREDSQLFNDGWVKACVELSRDIDHIGRQLLNSGIRKVRVKDFHRTGYNLFRELIDEGIELDQGFKTGPVAGIGEVKGFDYLLMVGMHAASGTDGFLPHTLTSKFASIEVNGRPMTEAELFASSMAPAGVAPAFFSGCPQACLQASKAIKNLQTFAIEKPLVDSPAKIREKLSTAAISSISSTSDRLYIPEGPFNTTIKMRDGEKQAQKLRQCWKIEGNGNELRFSSPSIHILYWQLIRLAYLTPFSEKYLNTSLMTANLAGRLAHYWARYRAKRLGLFQPS